MKFKLQTLIKSTELTVVEEQTRILSVSSSLAANPTCLIKANRIYLAVLSARSADRLYNPDRRKYLKRGRHVELI